MKIVGLGLVCFTCTVLCPLAHAQQVDRNSFGDVVSFVNQHSPLIVLKSSEGSAIAVWPAMQGRVLTSSAEGDSGRSFGWVNEQLIASGKVQPHINAVGGEDRLWLGPEGGQFSIFFAPQAPFDLDHWYTPSALDTEPFAISAQTPTQVSLSKDIELTNYSGTHFHVKINRTVKLLDRQQIRTTLKNSLPPSLKVVGYESDNRLTNVAPEAMQRSTGVLSLWVLGQFRAAPHATIILPVQPGPANQLGKVVKTDYFGQVPADRLEITPRAVFFRADSDFRSKLGVSPKRSKGVIGSYDPEHHVLTIVQFSEQPSADYVNSAWEIQKDPYAGDVANCYNDGIPAPGKPQLGHFYELESSSPAEALAPQASVEHTQRTIHLVGSEPDLDRLAISVLGVHLEQVVRFASSSVK